MSQRKQSKSIVPRSLVVRARGHFKLSRHSTDIDRLYRSERDYEIQFADLQAKIAKRQNVLVADRRYGVLIIFQGMDAAGKDSAIKHTMSCLNPQGVSVTSFGRPSDEELRHDFLWRSHAKLPGRGKVGIFNRSYYEETLTVRLHRELLEAQHLPVERTRSPNFWQERFADIRNHELYLERQGYAVIKFFLHLSKTEQKKRLLERLDNPSKNWKFDPNDVGERKLWLKFQHAYEECLRQTSTREAPWYVIPADDKQNARLLIATILLERLNDLQLTYPEVSPQRKREFARIRRSLK